MTLLFLRCVRPAALVICVCAVCHHACSAEDNADGAEATLQEVPITEGDRSHWAFRPIVKPAVPQTTDTQLQHPVDRFIQARLDEESLQLQPVAPPAVLLRRLSFDLLGLPPAREHLPAPADPWNETEWHQLLEEMLDHPEYGERWAQHWLDAARFAETDGFEHDKIRPEAWKYRDWVINALNDDLPFDEFVRLQIAGDQLQPDDADALTATRFCLSGPDMPDINSQEERRHTLLNELTATIGSAILGVQIGCAQCHDHKYDPISQADFYRVRAVFESSVHVKKNKSVTTLMEDPQYQKPSHLWLRGDFRRRGPELQPGVLRVAATGSFLLTSSENPTGGDRRLAFADWLVSPRNPLTARVLVNRVWQQHFGVGLCDTPGDFGYIGSTPSHEALLNWLAAEFMDQGWSLKRLHRLILTSRTWRQQSFLPQDVAADIREGWEKSRKVDENARLLSRFPRRRLEGEVIRDAMLVAAEALNSKRGGPGIRPPLPPEMKATLLKNQWDVTADVDEHDRRSIYVFARRNLRYPIFEAFDRPDANATCSVRNVTTTAPQSLYLLNSEFSHRMSQQMAAALVADSEDIGTIVTEAFLSAFGRAPTADELQECCGVLKEATDSQSLPDAVSELCLALFNANEFVYVD